MYSVALSRNDKGWKNFVVGNTCTIVHMYLRKWGFQGIAKIVYKFNFCGTRLCMCVCWMISNPSAPVLVWIITGIRRAGIRITDRCLVVFMNAAWHEAWKQRTFLQPQKNLQFHTGEPVHRVCSSQLQYLVGCDCVGCVSWLPGGVLLASVGPESAHMCRHAWWNSHTHNFRQSLLLLLLQGLVLWKVLLEDLFSCEKAAGNAVEWVELLVC